MSIHQNYAVFGLGRYGRAVAQELAKSGVQVLAVDSDMDIVNSVAMGLPLCKCADVTDVEALRTLGIEQMDVVIVAMASNLEASVMTIALCKELGVKTVIAKCGSELQKKIYLRMGADKVVFPEKESGSRLAKNLLSAGFVDMIELSKQISLVELAVRPEWVGKTLVELNLRKKYGMNVVAIRQNENLEINVDPMLPLGQEMMLVVIANTEKLARLCK